MTAEERNKDKGFVLDREDLQKEWVKCPVCEARVKSDNVEDHMYRVHGEKLKVEGKPIEKKFPYALLIVVVVIIVVIGSTGYAFYVNELNDTDDMNTESDSSSGQQENDDNQDTSGDWLESYEPRYDVGSGQDDWWINYPEINPEAGSSVEHLQWVLNDLKNKPVVIFAHSEGCAPCVQQQEDIEPVLDEYGSEVVYYNLMADGSDPKANEAYESYDPNGPPPYIPLTVMVTLEEHDGQVQVVWHSNEGATGQDWIRDYMKDAIYYHQLNSEEWGGA
ncbi:MAG: thioredoxin family protein [Thermoplasmata archaeon]